MKPKFREREKHAPLIGFHLDNEVPELLCDKEGEQYEIFLYLYISTMSKMPFASYLFNRIPPRVSIQYTPSWLLGLGNYTEIPEYRNYRTEKILKTPFFRYTVVFGTV